MYNFYDNFLEEHVAQLIDFEMKEVKWQYDYDSKPNGIQKHWHVFCGHNIDECNLNRYDFIEPIWNNIKNLDCFVVNFEDRVSGIKCADIVINDMYNIFKNHKKLSRILKKQTI